MKKLLIALLLVLLPTFVHAVTLTWTDTSGIEEGFGIEWAQSATPTSWTLIGKVGANVTTYTDAGAAVGTNCYQVYAYNVAGLSARSAAVCISVSIGPVTRSSLTTAPGGVPSGVAAK